MQSSELEKNKAVVQRYIDEVQNGHPIDKTSSPSRDNLAPSRETVASARIESFGESNRLSAEVKTFAATIARLRSISSVHLTSRGTAKGLFLT